MNIKFSSRWIIPLLLLLFAFFVNRIIGLVLIILYFAFVLWRGRAGILSHFAIRKYRQGDLEGAREWFSRAASKSGAEATVLLSYALVLIKLGAYEDAGKQVEKAASLKLSDYNTNVLAALRGILQWKSGEPRKAAEALSDLAESFRNTTLYGALGSLYISEGLIEDAYRFNTDAYDFDPYDSIIADNFARTRYLRGEIEEAEELLDEIIDREPLIAEPYINKALILESRGEIEDAAGMISQARNRQYSCLSYLPADEFEAICERIEAEAESESAADSTADDDSDETPEVEA